MHLILEEKEGSDVHVALVDTLIVPEISVNLFTILKMRHAETLPEYPHSVGRVWMRNMEGRYVGSFDEAAKGRPTLNCRTLLRGDRLLPQPPPTHSPSPIPSPR